MNPTGQSPIEGQNFTKLPESSAENNSSPTEGARAAAFETTEAPPSNSMIKHDLPVTTQLSTQPTVISGVWLSIESANSSLSTLSSYNALRNAFSLRQR